MTSHPSRSYTRKKSSARPTPCVPSTAIVQTLCVATITSRPRAHARFLPSLCRRRRRSVLPRRLRMRINIFLLSCDFFDFPPFPVPVLALYFVLATWVHPSHPASPRPSSVSGTNLVSTHRLLSSLPLSAAVSQFWCHGRWYGLTCGFNWQSTADAIGYAVMITARPGPNSPQEGQVDVFAEHPLIRRVTTDGLVRCALEQKHRDGHNFTQN